MQGSYTLDRVGFRTQQVSNLVIGDPANPDLTVRAGGHPASDPVERQRRGLSRRRSRRPAQGPPASRRPGDLGRGRQAAAAAERQAVPAARPDGRYSATRPSRWRRPMAGWASRSKGRAICRADSPASWRPPLRGWHLAPASSIGSAPGRYRGHRAPAAGQGADRRRSAPMPGQQPAIWHSREWRWIPASPKGLTASTAAAG